MDIDFFISHSKETKSTVAIPLVQILSLIGFNVWIDRKKITSGQHIYDELKKAIATATYCVAIIDDAFLSRKWTLAEMELFYQRENNENKLLIIPIYIGIDKEIVYKKIPWLEGRAFEKLNENYFDEFCNLEIICRIVGRYYDDNIFNNLETNYKKLMNYSFPCKETLITLINDKEYFSSDLRIAIIELCNISGMVNAIYKALTTSQNKFINIAFKFSNLLINVCFNATYVLTYSMYIAMFQVVSVEIEQLKLLLNSG